jgi:meso-butanediol dehydrogenase/(S,S)-butanediol dehydrogenase/diacetyl reductase
MGDRLKDKVAIISGGGSGIGAATAVRFAEEGARVVICGRRMEPLQQVVAQIEAAGGEACAFAVDVANQQAVVQLIDATVAKYGKLNILVNNAVAVVPGMLKKISADDWRKNFAVSVDGTMFMMQAAYPQLKQHRGAIVNMSSILGQFGTPAMTAYSAAKSAVVAMTRTAAIEWARDNIRANTVVPGTIMTPPTEAMLGDEKAQQAGAALVPLKRIGDPVECANAILFLASDEASYITGIALTVDGGRSSELYVG